MMTRGSLCLCLGLRVSSGECCVAWRTCIAVGREESFGWSKSRFSTNQCATCFADLRQLVVFVVDG